MGKDQFQESRIYWVDQICVFAILKLALRRIRDRTIPAPQVHYFGSTSSGRRLLKILQMLGYKLDSHPLDFGLGDLRSTDGTNLRYEVEDLADRIGKDVAAKIDTDYLTDYQLRQGYRKDRIRLYLKKSAAREVSEIVLKLCVVRELTKEKQNSVCSHIFLVRYTPLVRFVTNNDWSTPRVYIETYADPMELRVLIGEARRLAKQFIIAVLNGLKVWVKKKAVPHTSSDGEVRAQVAVQFVKGADLSVRNGLFWYPDSGLSPDQILIYFRQSSLPTETVLNQIKHHGLRWMILSDWELGRKDSRYLKDIVKTLATAARLAGLVCSRKAHLNWWQWRVLVDMEQTINWWAAFFREHRIQVHLHQVTNSPGAIPLSLAIESVGGIDFSYQATGSNFTDSNSHRVVANHVFFAWGPLYSMLMRQLGMASDVLLLGGHIYDYLISKVREDAYRRRQQLFQNGCNYVICLFDTSFNEEAYFTPKMMEEFYETILNWILNDPELGLLIKPKSPDNLERIPEIMSLVEKVVGKGQCMLLNSKISSFEAALSSDITVGSGINSAVLEAAVAGIPGVHFDLAAMERHPLYNAGFGRFVFNDADLLFEKLQAHRKDPDGMFWFGNHGSYLDLIDPFQDGRAAERMGTYIRWLLKKLEEGADSRQALAAANSRYTEVVGADYIVEAGKN